MNGSGTVAPLAAANHFEHFTRLPYRLFYIIGVTPFATSVKPWTVRTIIKAVYFFFSIMNVILSIIAEIIYVCLSFSRSDFVELTSLVLCIGFLMLAIMKVCTILWQRRTMDDLMCQLQAICPQTVDDQRLYDSGTYVARAVRMQRLYACIQMTMIWLFNLYPMTLTLIGFVQHGRWRLDFPYILWYPYDPYGRGWFELNYMSQMWAAFWAATGILGADLLMCGIVLQLCMHYDRLQRRLLHFRPGNGATVRPEKSHADYAELADCVRTHDAVLRLTAQLDGIFGVCVLFNLVSSIVILCMLCFLVVTAGVSVALVKYVLTLVTCTGQIFVVCLLGERCIEAVGRRANV